MPKEALHRTSTYTIQHKCVALLVLTCPKFRIIEIIIYLCYRGDLVPSPASATPACSRDRKEVYTSNDDVSSAYFSRSLRREPFEGECAGDTHMRSVDTDSSITDVSQSTDRPDAKSNDMDFMAPPRIPFNDPRYHQQPSCPSFYRVTVALLLLYSIHAPKYLQ